MSWGWVEQNFERVGQLNPLETQLIRNGKLKVRLLEGNPDSIDIRSAELIGAALARRSSLCIVFPDLRPRRPAFLFAYALLNYWEKLRSLGISQQAPVLYCGVRPGIREQLSNVSVTGLSASLGGIFDQVHLARGAQAPANGNLSSSAGSLPRVVTAFGPGDSASLVSIVKPSWIAIDLGDAPAADWVADLVVVAKQKGIPVIAWGTNPLSSAISQFGLHADVVSWAMSRAFDGVATFGKYETAEMMFQPFLTTSITPTVLTGEHLGDHNMSLARAIECLRRFVPRGLLAQNAVQVHWRLLRTIENLSVPLSFYEAEARNFWGMPPIQKLLETCRHFQLALATADRSLAQGLDQAISHLEQALDWLSTNDPPLWTGLTQIIHEERDATCTNAVTFPSRSRKELFLLALLARLNITSSELEELALCVTSTPELLSWDVNVTQRNGRDERATQLLGQPKLLLAGLPTLSQMPRLLPIFFAEEVEILLHEYQLPLLAYSAREWNKGLSPNLNSLVDVLSNLTQVPRLDVSLFLPDRVKLAETSSVDLKSGKKRGAGRDQNQGIWEAADLRKEIGYLIDSDEDSVLTQDITGEADPANIDPVLSVDQAIELSFTENWRGLFDPAQRLNFIGKDTNRIEERYVRSLRVGDTVLIIPHQKRQSLYSLIISRIHQHESIEVHLALLRRWHEDFRAGFQRWSNLPARRGHQAPALDQFLIEMRKEGSTLTSALAIRFWLEGVTLSPIDADDLLRVATILELRFVKERHRQIDAAANRIRGLHRGLSNKLNRWLEDRARGLAEIHDNQVIDASLGLTFGDIRESFVILQINGIRAVQGPFLCDTLGSIERSAGHDARRAFA